MKNFSIELIQSLNNPNADQSQLQNSYIQLKSEINALLSSSRNRLVILRAFNDARLDIDYLRLTIPDCQAIKKSGEPIVRQQSYCTT